MAITDVTKQDSSATLHLIGCIICASFSKRNWDEKVKSFVDNNFLASARVGATRLAVLANPSFTSFS
jgi:hypothetical protein